ncbi:MAG: DUF6116 family protein [Gammaproteobacteria bacterium]
MGISKLAKGGVAGIVLRWATRLRFPYLFVLTALLFVLNLILPDPFPFADELLMGLIAVLLGSLRKKRSADRPDSDDHEAP